MLFQTIYLKLVLKDFGITEGVESTIDLDIVPIFQIKKRKRTKEQLTNTQ